MTSPSTTPVVDVEARVAELVATTGQSEESVRAILGALNDHNGDPVGTVREHKPSGAIAHRVWDRDVVKWRISHEKDGVTYEMSATKPDWSLLREGRPAGTDEVTE